MTEFLTLAGLSALGSAALAVGLAWVSKKWGWSSAKRDAEAEEVDRLREIVTRASHVATPDKLARARAARRRLRELAKKG